MSEEKKQIIDELVKEVEEISNIAIIRFILGVAKSFKKNRKWVQSERTSDKAGNGKFETNK